MYRFLAAILALYRKVKNGTETAIEEMQTEIDSINEGFHYMGSVATKDDLPDDSQKGDKYTVTDEDNAQYVWDGTEWQNVTTAITEIQINALYG